MTAFLTKIATAIGPQAAPLSTRLLSAVGAVDLLVMAAIRLTLHKTKRLVHRTRRAPRRQRAPHPLTAARLSLEEMDIAIHGHRTRFADALNKNLNDLRALQSAHRRSAHDRLELSHTSRPVLSRQISATLDRLRAEAVRNARFKRARAIGSE